MKNEDYERFTKTVTNKDIRLFSKELKREGFMDKSGNLDFSKLNNPEEVKFDNKTERTVQIRLICLGMACITILILFLVHRIQFQILTDKVIEISQVVERLDETSG